MKFSKVMKVVAVALALGVCGAVIYGIGGSVVPGFGTAAGAAVGFVLCATFGALVAYHAVSKTA
jgi:hypothetical protein